MCVTLVSSVANTLLVRWLSRRSAPWPIDQASAIGDDPDDRRVSRSLNMKSQKGTKDMKVSEGIDVSARWT